MKIRVNITENGRNPLIRGSSGISIKLSRNTILFKYKNDDHVNAIKNVCLKVFSSVVTFYFGLSFVITFSKTKPNHVY